MRNRAKHAMTMGLAAAALVVACNGDGEVTPKPDTSAASTTSGGGDDGSGGAGGASSSTGSGGSGASGGGSTEDSSGGYVSGSRLKAQFFEGSDGSKIFTGIYDTQLNTPCNPQTMYDDDSVRCVPTATFDDDRILYSDSGCTQAFTWVLAGTESQCAAPTHALAGFGATTCDAPRKYQVRAVTGEIAAPVGAIYRFTGFACVVWAVPPNVDTFYGLGPNIEPSALVAMTATMD